MSHPLEFLPLRVRKLLFFTFLFLTVVLFAVFRVLDQPLRTDHAPDGIVSFELAGDTQTARLITDSWKQASLLLSGTGSPNPDIINVPYAFAAFGLGLDYLFMPVYALLLVLRHCLPRRSIPARSGPWPWPQDTGHLQRPSSTQWRTMPYSRCCWERSIRTIRRSLRSVR